MRRKFAFLVSTVACCAVLASCGGGDDSSTPTPTPTPTATPTPTPTPTPTAVDFDFTKAFSTSVTNTAYSFAFFAPTGGAETWNDGSRHDGTSTIAYGVSPDSAVFDWPDSATLTSFGAADLKTATAALRSYAKGSDKLSMELPFGQILRVTYQTAQAYVRDTVAGTLRSNRVALFFNPVTTTSAIATDLTYSGTAQVAGGLSGTTAPGVFSASATTLTVTASDKKIAGTIQIVETVNGAPVVRASLPISATVGTGGAFSGTIDDTASAFKGHFVGSLAGPSREEVFLIFNVTHTDGREFIGSLIGN